MSQTPNPEIYRISLYLLGVVSTALVGIIIWLVNGFNKKIELLFKKADIADDKNQENEKAIGILEKDVSLLRSDHNKNHGGKS